jgi:hypothetical protein
MKMSYKKFNTAVEFVNLIKEIIKKENPQAEFRF